MRDLRLTGRHTSLMVVARGDPMLKLRSVLWWLRSRFVSGALCASVSTFLLLHYCSVCQVGNRRRRIDPRVMMHILDLACQKCDRSRQTASEEMENWADYIKCKRCI